MISIQSLQKNYNNKLILDINKLEIFEGERIGIIGNNGAGKTTLFRILLDLIDFENGQVIINNSNSKNADYWKDFTGSFLDHGFLIDFLSPKEFFFFIGNLYGLANHEVEKALKKFEIFLNDEILTKEGKLIRDFSFGCKQKIGIISALIINPKLLILDEPFSFLDPRSQTILKQILLKYNTDYQATLIISSHNLNYIMDISSRIIVLERGRIIFDKMNLDSSVAEIEYYLNRG